MKHQKRLLISILLSIIGAVAWFIVDYQDHGFGISIFGGPIMVLGSIGIPNFIEMRKNRKCKGLK
ncbi:MAG: hypothetical protein K0S76_706 [Herbinix sp.]|nr:hypothetical protein [Herbinix sp.]